MGVQNPNPYPTLLYPYPRPLGFLIPLTIPSFNSRTNYVPLRQDKISGATPPRYFPSNLPIRTHEELMNQARDIEMAPNNATHERLAKEHGIKGIPILSSISSISFPSSFPFDFMHLIWENLIPNLIESLSSGLASSKTWITKTKFTLSSHTSGMTLELLQLHARRQFRPLLGPQYLILH